MGRDGGQIDDGVIFDQAKSQGIGCGFRVEDLYQFHAWRLPDEISIGISALRAGVDEAAEPASAPAGNRVRTGRRDVKPNVPFREGWLPEDPGEPMPRARLSKYGCGLQADIA